MALPDEAPRRGEEFPSWPSVDNGSSAPANTQSTPEDVVALSEGALDLLVIHQTCLM
jgi:hypothetical protein